jgi:hypothetical protein
MMTREGDTIQSIGSGLAELSDWGTRHQRLVVFQQGTAFEMVVVQVEGSNQAMDGDGCQTYCS